MEETYNFRPVDDTLATAGMPTEDQLRSVAAHGFEVVINLAIDDKERDLVRSLGMTYVHIPVVFTAPAEADLQRFFDAMDASVGRKKFVHCAANKRVSVFVGLYRVLRLGWERERAFDLVKALWEPNEVWRDFVDQTLAQRP